MNAANWRKLMRMKVKPGGRTAPEIAAIVGCDKTRVYQVERSALAKLRLIMDQFLSTGTDRRVEHRQIQASVNRRDELSA